MNAIRSFLKTVTYLIILLGFVIYFGPRETVDREVAFVSPVIPQDIDRYLNDKEAQFPDVIEDAQKQIIWHDKKGHKTPYSIIYLHGFSATSHEMRPVPEMVAATLGANLFYTRFAGHGRTGDAMMDGSPERWVQDAIEAIEIGAQIGEKVIVMATSNGGSIATYVLANPDYANKVSGVVLTSPAYKLAHPMTALLDFPWVRYWGNFVAGKRRGFEPENEMHGKYWTTEYPTLSTFPMTTIQRAVRKLNFAKMTTPALFFVSDEDIVVDVGVIRGFAEKWGADHRIETRTMTAQDDPYHHVLAGNVLSPHQTSETISIITRWASEL